MTYGIGVKAQSQTKEAQITKCLKCAERITYPKIEPDLILCPKCEKYFNCTKWYDDSELDDDLTLIDIY